MGYTHYWTFKSSHGRAKETEETYRLALRQCQRIIRAHNKKLKSQNEKHPDRLSGYSVHTKVDQYGGLEFNGVGDLSHETFSMREHFSENEGFNFCKTAQKPYDVCVTACLIVMRFYLGHLIEVSSDGDASDWTQGLKLAKTVTKIKGLAVPIKKRDAA